VSGEAVICLESTDEEYKKKFKSEEEFNEKVKKYWNDTLWYNTNDKHDEEKLKKILPVERYLLFCLSESRILGDEYFENFIHTSYLADNSLLLDYLNDNSYLLEKLNNIKFY
jgi:hypothetical protein